MLLPQIIELLQTIEKELAAAEAQVSGLKDSKSALEQLRDRFSTGNSEGAQVSLPTPISWRDVSITEGAERLIREHGPLDTREIADQLRLRGVRTKSANFIPTVYASLRESPRVVRLEEARKWDLGTNHPQMLAEKRARISGKPLPPPALVKKKGNAKR